VRVAYWTTACLEPAIEAVSKEVFDLAASFPASRIFAVSPHLSAPLRLRARALGLHTRFTPLLQCLIPVIELSAAVNHVYGEVSPWPFCKSLRRRPIVLTIASEKGRPVDDFLARCEVVVAQTEGMKARLAGWGVESKRVRLIYPGIDLARFKPRDASLPAGRPNVLFATFPREVSELDARGVSFLLETARKLPQIDFSLLLRPFSGGGAARSLVSDRVRAEGLHNITLLEGTQERMDDLYRSHRFTVIPYTTSAGGKECPLSLVEGLACGVPVLISSVAPFSRFVLEHDCGRVFECRAESFAAALDDAMNAYSTLSDNARHAADAFFNLRNTRRDYANIYDAIA